MTSTPPLADGTPPDDEDATPTTPGGLRPWSGRAAPADKALMLSIGGIGLFYLAMWPLRPLMIASAPLALALVTGSKVAIAAVAAYAASGRYPLWWALAAGVIGMAKFDWLFWWAGRRWGAGAVNLFAQNERSKRTVLRARDRHPWVLRLLVMCGRLPGMPGGVFYAAAGWAGMGLMTFLVLDVLGVLIVAGGIVLLGYSLGESAVDVIEVVDSYAIWLSLAIVFGIALLPTIRKRWRARRSPGPVDPSDEDGGLSAETEEADPSAEDAAAGTLAVGADSTGPQRTAR